MPKASSSPVIDVLPPESAEMDPLLEQLADWMDTRFEIPGFRWRFGFDALLGLIPGLGDSVTFLISCYILLAAARLGVPRITLARMGLNSVIDFVLGSIPLLGDLFDVAWKSNTKNVALLRRTLEATPRGQRRANRGDWLFVLGIVAALLIVLATSIAIAWATIVWMFSGLATAVPL